MKALRCPEPSEEFGFILRARETMGGFWREGTHRLASAVGRLTWRTGGAGVREQSMTGAG